MTTKALQAENVLKQLNKKLNTVINGQLELPLSKLDNSRNILRKTPKKDFLTNLKNKKKEGLKVADQLLKLSDNKIVQKTAEKLTYCSVHGAFREVSEGQLHKIGQALCKNKLCPVCQEVLSHKRRMKAMDFFEENQEELKNYNYYHLVLTVQHTSTYRNYNYVSELITAFQNLRGTKSRRGSLQLWKVYVNGGYYSIEAKWGKDSPHIHIHAILITPKNVKQPDLEFIKKNWKDLTNSTQVQIDPIYFLQDEYVEGAKQHKNKDKSISWRVEYNPQKHGTEHLKRAFMESLKYTIKTDELFKSLAKNPSQGQKEFVEQLLLCNNNFNNRFGFLRNTKENREIFTGLEKLALNFKDLSLIEKTDMTLIDVETGEEKKIEDTRILITKFSNVQVKEKTDEYTIYQLISKNKYTAVKGNDMRKACVVLSKTLKGKKKRAG